MKGNKKIYLTILVILALSLFLGHVLGKRSKETYIAPASNESQYTYKGDSQDASTTETQSSAATEDTSNSVSDIRWSEEQIKEFYDTRNRGEDLEDRYDRLALDADFGEGCEAYENDRILFTYQLREFLEEAFGSEIELSNLEVRKDGMHVYADIEVNTNYVCVQADRTADGYEFCLQRTWE